MSVELSEDLVRRNTLMITQLLDERYNCFRPMTADEESQAVVWDPRVSDAEYKVCYKTFIYVKTLCPKHIPTSHGPY